MTLCKLRAVCLIFLSSWIGVSAQFVNRASEYDITHNFNGFGFGSGVSLVDINGDGRDDLSLGTGLGASIAVYLQTDTGLTLSQEISLSYITQAIRGLNWVDYDNDGDKDLFISHWDFLYGGGVALYNQDASGQFNDVTWASGIQSVSNPYYGSTWADCDNDGYLDLYICNYLIGENGQNAFYHNNGDCTFSNLTASLGLEDTQGFSFNSVFFDSDLDGDLDLYTSNDRLSENRFYLNIDGQEFEDVSLPYGMNGVMNSMGAELGDYDNDHDLDLYVTNTVGMFQGHQGNAIFRNQDSIFAWLQGHPTEDIVGTFWGCNFIDFDYDRDLDLFTVNSNRDPQGFSAYMYLNNGCGSFSAYPGTEFQSHEGHHFASAQGDLNSDGFLDLVVADGYLGTSQIWIGPATTNHWIKVLLEGSISNRDGIGSLIEVWVSGVKRIDQTTCTSSHLAQDSFNYPFGLGMATQADSVIIHWPSGVINIIQNVTCDQLLHVLEDSSQTIFNCIPGVELLHETVSGYEQEFEIVTSAPVSGIQWTIDGLDAGEGNTLTYSFTELGEHLICAEAITVCGSSLLCDSITLICDLPIASYELALDELNLLAYSTSEADSVRWSLGDGTLLLGDEITYQFANAGSYEVCMMAFNECGVDTLCTPIQVTCTLPISGFTWNTSSQDLSAQENSSYADSTAWFLDGLFISDFPSLYQESLFEGPHELCLVVFNSCGTDSLCEEFIILANSLSEEALIGTLSVFPNPCSDILYLNLKKVEADCFTLMIYDSTGHLAMSYRIKDRNKNEGLFQLDTKSLDPGSYTLAVREDQVILGLARFVKH